MNELIITPFEDIKISTETIIACSNLYFDLNLLYTYLPITDYSVIKRKRGRKKKDTSVDPNLNVPQGSIISVQNKTNVRGVILKKKLSQTYFLNSITVIVVLENQKLINTKISKNGKFQITGCKDNKHFLNCVKNIYHHIRETEIQIGEKICRFKSEKSTVPRIIFNVVMKNIDFKAGFPIQRDLLDTFINMNTNFNSYYEGSITTGVNIKIKSEKHYDSMLDCLEIEDKEIKHSMVEFEEYLNLLDEKERKKELKKVKYFTFLVFCSGSTILSGSGPDMKKIYENFMKILLLNRDKFEEKLITE